MNKLPGLTQCAANCNWPINDCNCLFVAFVLCNHTFTKSIISVSFSCGTEISMVLNFDPKIPLFVKAQMLCLQIQLFQVVSVNCLVYEMLNLLVL